MGKLAFLFPGQASQYPGMGKELAANHPAARSVFEEADKALGFSISDVCFNGSEEALKLTANTQPAILTVSVAAYRVLEENGIQPAFVAGHSLGEYFRACGGRRVWILRMPCAWCGTAASTCRRRCPKALGRWPRSWDWLPRRSREFASKWRTGKWWRRAI